MAEAQKYHPLPELQAFRKKYPQYDDLDDRSLAESLGSKYSAYKDLPQRLKPVEAELGEIAETAPLDPIPGLPTIAGGLLRQPAPGEAEQQRLRSARPEKRPSMAVLPPTAEEQVERERMLRGVGERFARTETRSRFKPVEGIRPEGWVAPTKARGPFEDPSKETQFQQWYADLANRMKINPDPDDPRHFYDYRRAFDNYDPADWAPDPSDIDPETGKPRLHGSSKYKLPGHPTEFIETPEGVLHTPTGEIVPEKTSFGAPLTLADMPRGVQQIIEPWKHVGKKASEKIQGMDIPGKVGELGKKAEELRDNLLTPKGPQARLDAIRGFGKEVIDKGAGLLPETPRALQETALELAEKAKTTIKSLSQWEASPGDVRSAYEGMSSRYYRKPREKSREAPGVARESFIRGVGNVFTLGGSTLEWLGAPGSDALKQFGEEIHKAHPRTIEPKEFTWDRLVEPEFYATTVVESVPLTLSLIPAAIIGAYGGLKVAGVMGLGAFGKLALASLGGGTFSRTIESAFEAGGSYEEALNKGRPKEEANRVANKTFAANMALTGVDAAQFVLAFTPLSKIPGASRILQNRILAATTKFGTLAISEALEEGYQEAIQQWALTGGAKITPQLQEAMAIGGIFGLGLGGAGTVYTSLKNRIKGELSQGWQDPFAKAYDDAIAEGVTPFKAELMALDAIAETPEGQEAINEILDKLKEAAALHDEGGVESPVVPEEAAEAPRPEPKPGPAPTVSPEVRPPPTDVPQGKTTVIPPEGAGGPVSAYEPPAPLPEKEAVKEELERGPLQTWPNIKDGTEIRIYERDDGRFFVSVWDLDADQSIGVGRVYGKFEDAVTFAENQDRLQRGEKPAEPTPQDLQAELEAAEPGGARPRPEEPTGVLPGQDPGLSPGVGDEVQGEGPVGGGGEGGRPGEPGISPEPGGRAGRDPGGVPPSGEGADTQPLAEPTPVEPPQGGIEGMPLTKRHWPPIPQNSSSMKRNYRPANNPTQAQEIVRIRDIVRQIEQDLQVPIRTGFGFGSRPATRAYYRGKEEVIRAKYNDIEGIMHEVGHHISKKLFGKTVQEMFSGELVKMGRALYGNTKPRGGYANEGVAEAIRMWVFDPAELHKQAPRFEGWLNAKFNGDLMELAKVLEKAKQEWERYRDQPDGAKVLSMVSRGEKPKRQTTWDDFYEAVFEKLHPIFVFTKIMEKAAGRALLHMENPALLARLSRGWVGKADMFIEYAPLDWGTLKAIPGAKSLKEIHRQIPGEEMDDFLIYRVAAQAIERAKQGKETGLDMAAAGREFDRLNAERPHYAAILQDFKDFAFHLRKFLYDADMLTPEAFAKMNELDYSTPFHRLMEDREPIRHAMDSKKRQGFVDVPSPLKRFKGSVQMILDPYETDIKNVYAIVQAAVMNEVGKVTVELAQRGEGMGAFVEGPLQRKVSRIVFKASEIERQLKEFGIDDLPPDLGETFLHIFRPSMFKPEGPYAWITGARDISLPADDVSHKGKRNLYQFHPDLFRGLQNLNPVQASWLWRMLGIPARTLRVGATSLSPDFVLRNPAKDYWGQYVFSKYGYGTWKSLRGIPGLELIPGSPFDFIAGIHALINKTEDYQEWLASGGPQAMLVSLDRTTIQKNLTDLRRPGGLAGINQFIITHPIEALRLVSEYGELGTRLGEFIAGKKIEEERGVSTKESILRRGLASRDGTVDYGRAGTYTQAINQISAFFTANLGGKDKIYRAFKEDPKGTMLRALIGITIPAIALYLMNQDDPRYDELPRWQKDMFYLFLTGSMTREQWDQMSDDEKAQFNEANPIYRYPIPFDMGILFGVMPVRVLEWYKDRDPGAINSLMDTLLATVPNPAPTGATTLVENIFNWSFFRNKPNYPPSREKLMPMRRYGPYTTETTKRMADWAHRMGLEGGFSPAALENLVRGVLGTGGMAVLQAVDRLFFDQDDKPATTWSDFPGVRAFITRFPSGTESISKFYDEYKRVASVGKTYEDYINDNDVAAAAEFQKEHAQDIEMAKQLRGAARRMRKDWNRYSEIRKDTRLSRADKRRKLDAQMFKIMRRARSALRAARPDTRLGFGGAGRITRSALGR